MKLAPAIIIFDVDGVLVDVRGSFHRSTVQTVQHFTGRRVSMREIHRWKNQSGYNDDWKLTTDWICSLGVPATYPVVKRQFMKFYWGNGTDGNVARERWLVSRVLLRRLARRAELAIFTGRTLRELRHTFARFSARPYFLRIVTMDDVVRCKPDPEGLLRILRGRDGASALYLGDNVDDALAARAAGVPFLGVLPHDGQARGARVAHLKELGALAVLSNVNQLEDLLRL